MSRLCENVRKLPFEDGVQAFFHVRMRRHLGTARPVDRFVFGASLDARSQRDAAIAGEYSELCRTHEYPLVSVGCGTGIAEMTRIACNWKMKGSAATRENQGHPDHE